MVQKNFGMRIGSRAQVFHGTAKQTSGGLQKCDLKKNKRGAIVSRRASARAKKENRLVKAGFVTQKGKFGVVQMGGNLFRNLSINKTVKINNIEYNLVEKVKNGTMFYYELNKTISNNEKKIYYLVESDEHKKKLLNQNPKINEDSIFIYKPNNNSHTNQHINPHINSHISNIINPRTNEIKNSNGNNSYFTINPLRKN